MAKSSQKPQIDASFDHFPGEQRMLEECEHQALKEMLTDQVRKAMSDNHLSKTAMAERMRTSRRQLDRLLDPAVANVTLAMSRWQRCPRRPAVGRELHIALV